MIARKTVVSCHAVAAAERPATKPGPIVMNGQVLHSITQERLELVKTFGPYLEEQVSIMDCLGSSSEATYLGWC